MAAQFGYRMSDASDRFIWRQEYALFFDVDGTGGSDKCSLQPYLLTLS